MAASVSSKSSTLKGNYSTVFSQLLYQGNGMLVANFLIFLEWRGWEWGVFKTADQ